MNLIVYQPTDTAAKEMLAKRVSEVHGRAVMQTINDLPQGNELKLKLLDEIKEGFI